MSLHAALNNLEYPCDYAFKLVCLPQAVEAVRAQLLQSVGTDTPVKDVHQRASRSGKYIALTVMIEARNAAQIEQAYADLQPIPGIVTSL